MESYKSAVISYSRTCRIGGSDCSVAEGSVSSSGWMFKKSVGSFYGFIV
jgi:hypothetical protein